MGLPHRHWVESYSCGLDAAEYCRSSVALAVLSWGQRSFIEFGFQLQNVLFQFLKYLKRQSVPVILVPAPLGACGLHVLRYLPELSLLKALSYLPICLLFVI